VFSDEKLLPSEVRKRSRGKRNEDPTGETDKELHMDVPIEKEETKTNTSANNLKNKSPPDSNEE
jgi:hypothetical protein